MITAVPISRSAAAARVSGGGDSRPDASTHTMTTLLAAACVPYRIKPVRGDWPGVIHRTVSAAGASVAGGCRQATATTVIRSTTAGTRCRAAAYAWPDRSPAAYTS